MSIVRVNFGAIKPIPAYAPAAVAAAPVESDHDRRARLNARLQTMVKDGKGVRLTDAPAAAQRRRAEVRRSASADRVAARPVRAEPAASFAPPPLNANAAPFVRRSGYTPPYLDLKTPPRVPDNDLECLTQAIYYEARNESEAGQAAVAEVVLNRSRHRAYPKRVCEVVYQRNSRTCQFTFTCDGSIGRRAVNPVAWARAERIAREVYEGRSASQLPKNSVNYHANYVRPSWGSRLARVRQIGAHIFRVLLTGEGERPDLTALEGALAPLCYGLTLRDHTRLPLDLWKRREEDSLTGLFLREMWALCEQDPDDPKLQLAARYGLAALEDREEGNLL